MADKSREEIKQIIIETLKPLGVLRISLFGSFSRHELTETSDIDILVRLPPAKNRTLIGLRWFTLDQELQEKIGRPVDLVTEDALMDALKPIIERDLEVIYEKAG
ncbi:MAG: nucleotidyltransferase family protein [Bdellovibrionales bacterium]